MKIIIIDDEPAMLLVLKRMLADVSDAELIGSFQEAEQALKFAKTEAIDLAFVDIQIGKDNGLKLAQAFRELHPNMDIVFVTSHTEFAFDAFETYPLDYIVKPVSKNRLLQTLNRVKTRLQHYPTTSKQPHLSIQLLGGIAVSSEQTGNVKWISKKSEELFLYLLLRAGRPVSKEVILDNLFEGMLPKNAEMYLNTTVYQLRKALHPHGFKENVITVNQQYRLDITGMDIDLLNFEQGIAQLDWIDENNITKALKLEKLYNGELFGVKAYAWSLTDIERISNLYSAFAKKLIAWLNDHDRLSIAVDIAKKAISYNEFNEQLLQQLIHSLAALGDRLSIRKYYEQYAASFTREFNEEPSPAVQELFEQYK